MLSRQEFDNIMSSSDELISLQDNTEAYIAVPSNNTANSPEAPPPGGFPLFPICGGVVAMICALSYYNKLLLGAIAKLIKTTK